jgi:hypothetical protein
MTTQAFSTFCLNKITIFTCITVDYSDNSDLSQDEGEDSSVCGYDSDIYKYSDFIEAESTESLSGHTDDDHSKRFNKLMHSMENLDTEDKGETESSKRRAKLSRMGRFKSTENIISGIVDYYCLNFL